MRRNRPGGDPAELSCVERKVREIHDEDSAGAILGLAAYGTYDITNLATLRNWPLAMSLVDMAWGTLLTALTAAGGYLTARILG